MLLEDKPKKELTHVGLRPDRLIEDGPEKIISELWDQKNKRLVGLNNGYTTLELILNHVSIDWSGHSALEDHRFTTVTQREADVVATVIQWLGSGGGKAFLVEAERKIKEYHEKELEKFNKKYN